MALGNQTLMDKLECAIIAKLSCNEVGIVGFNLWVNHMNATIELHLSHSNGYCHVLYHYDVFSLLHILDRYLNPEMETYEIPV